MTIPDKEQQYDKRLTTTTTCYWQTQSKGWLKNIKNDTNTHSWMMCEDYLKQLDRKMDAKK